MASLPSWALWALPFDFVTGAGAARVPGVETPFAFLVCLALTNRTLPESPSRWGQQEECGFGPLDTRTRGGRGRGWIQSPCGAGESPALLPLTPSCAKGGYALPGSSYKIPAQIFRRPSYLSSSPHPHLHTCTRAHTHAQSNAPRGCWPGQPVLSMARR